MTLIRFFFFSFAICIMLALSACGGPQHAKMLNPDYSEESLNKLSSTSLQKNIRNDAVQLRFVEMKDVETNPIVFIHGTPGDWTTFSFVLGNLELQKTNHMISVDRLDWGQSTLEDEKLYPSFDDQVDAISQMIRAATDKPVILVGHSLGASLAPSVAVKHPELVAGMILVAGTIDPALGKPRWYNRIARFKVIQWFLPEELIKSNKEIYALEKGLRDIDKDWAKLTVPVTVIQGEKDRLVSPRNIDYAERQLKHLGNDLTVISLPKVGHFIPWEHTDQIIEAIQYLNKKL